MDWTENDVKTWKRGDAGGVYYVRIPGLFGWKSSGKTRKGQAVEWALAQATGGHSSDVTLEAYSRKFFLPGLCPIIRIREAAGGTATAKHWADMRAVLVRYILPRWGKTMVAAVDAKSVFAWLSSPDLIHAKPEDGDSRTWKKTPLSAAHRNRILVALNMVMGHAVFDRIIEANPIKAVPRMRLDSQPRGTFSDAELGKMFGGSDEELEAIWGGRLWATLYLVLADTGLRPSEALALRWRDWHSAHLAFVVSRRIDSLGNPGPLKTAKVGVAKKAVLVLGRTAELLDEMGAGADPDHLIFPATKFRRSPTQPMRVAVAGNHFVDRLPRAGVDTGGRTLYCLRHSANTRFRTELDDEAARLLMGHTNPKMTEHYDHPEDFEVIARARRAAGLA